MASDLIAQLITILDETFGIVIDESQVDTAFDDLTVDSLVLVELALVIRKRYGVTLTDQEISDAGTLSGLAARVDARSVVS